MVYFLKNRARVFPRVGLRFIKDLLSVCLPSSISVLTVFSVVGTPQWQGLIKTESRWLMWGCACVCVCVFREGRSVEEGEWRGREGVAAIKG